MLYMHYLQAIISFEQISDEKRDLKPLLDANKKLIFLLKNIRLRLCN